MLDVAEFIAILIAALIFAAPHIRELIDKG